MLTFRWDLAIIKFTLNERKSLMLPIAIANGRGWSGDPLAKAMPCHNIISIINNPKPNVMHMKTSLVDLLTLVHGNKFQY